MAARVWDLPVPGAPEMRVTGSVRLRSTARRWVGVNRNGETSGGSVGPVGVCSPAGVSSPPT